MRKIISGVEIDPQRHRGSEEAQGQKGHSLARLVITLLCKTHFHFFFDDVIHNFCGKLKNAKILRVLTLNICKTWKFDEMKKMNDASNSRNVTVL